MLLNPLYRGKEVLLGMPSGQVYAAKITDLDFDGELLWVQVLYWSDSLDRGLPTWVTTESLFEDVAATAEAATA